MTSAETIDFLYQRELIRDVLARYCRAIDRLDEDLLRSTYFEDAWDDHGPFKGGREDFIAWVIPCLRREYITTSHHVTTQLIQVDGDVANVESYAIVVQDRMHQARRYRCTAHCRYVDRLERRNGEWRIARRVVVTDSASTSEAPPWLGMSEKALGNGLRDRSDPCYCCSESVQHAA
jgi:SnoaL-like domain